MANIPGVESPIRPMIFIATLTSLWGNFRLPELNQHGTLMAAIAQRVGSGKYQYVNESVPCGVALLIGVFLFAIRQRTPRETPKPINHDVFDKDPSFYSSDDQQDK